MCDDYDDEYVFIRDYWCIAYSIAFEFFFAWLGMGLTGERGAGGERGGEEPERGGGGGG